GGIAVGLSAYSSSLLGGSPVSVSDSDLHDQDSASARRSSSVTLAPTSLSSTVAHQFTSSTRHPRPPGSTLVARQSSLTSGLLWLCLVPSSPRLHWTPYSLQFVLGPHSLGLHHALLCPHLHLNRQTQRLRHVLPDPRRYLGSSAPPWSPLPPAPPLSVGSSLRRLRPGCLHSLFHPGCLPAQPAPPWSLLPALTCSSSSS
ncbi:hypothetical protein PO909_029503, partial [Leuciscus waleckii]